MGCYSKINRFCAVDHSHSRSPNDEFPLNSTPIFLKTAFANREFKLLQVNSSHLTDRHPAASVRVAAKCALNEYLS